MFAPACWVLGLLATLLTAGCTVSSAGLVTTAATDASPSVDVPIVRLDARPGDVASTPDAVIVPGPDAPPKRDDGPPPIVDAPPAPVEARPPVDLAAPIDTTPPRPDVRPDLPSRPRALFVGGPTAASPSDPLLRTRLGQLGFDVTSVMINTMAEADAVRAMVPSHRVIVISESVGAMTNIGMALRDAPIGLVTSEPTSYDELGMVANASPQARGTMVAGHVRMLPIGHALSAGLTGVVKVTQMPSLLTYGLPLVGAVGVATVGDDASRMAVLAYDRGTPLNHGPAPGRRVGWFGEEGAVYLLTDAGWRLFDAAVRWAAD